jgi:2-polyprenyl-3-methyl-5-hydroxy-6-metoxy-1,4-benzoquinol methylase
MNLNEGYMKNLHRMSASVQPSWFKTWFDTNFYHKLYAHRNESEAVHFIDNLLPMLDPSPNARMLDLGCGAGRHSKYLASKGYNVTGLDLAASSIFQAQRHKVDNLQFYQHDMRNAFGENQFDFVLNFFTSFGYFDTEAEHIKVIHNIAKSLKTGGVVLMDYINAAYASRHIVANEEKNIDGVMYYITRWMDEKHFFKKITVDLQATQPFHFTEKVAKFQTPDFERMFATNNLELQVVYGDYDLNAFDIDQSPRLILIGRKKGR